MNHRERENSIVIRDLGPLSPLWNEPGANGGTAVLHANTNNMTVFPAGTGLACIENEPTLKESQVSLIRVGNTERTVRPELISVDLFRMAKEKPKPGSSGRVVAFVEWSSGKGSNEAKVDFVHGTRFTVTASYLRVTAKYFGEGPPVTVSAEAVYGSLGADHSQYTDLGPCEGLTNDWRYIPSFARDLHILGGGDTTVDFSADAASAIVRVAGPGPIPVPNGVDFYRVQSQNVFLPVFRLYL